ncbi:MAG: hypothetical protein ACJ763_01650 [Bdellovibrionia bacterium]
MKSSHYKSAWIGMLAVLSGCSFAPVYIQDGAKSYSRVPAQDVKVYASDTLKIRYEVIGSIAVDTLGEAKAAYDLLREKAASHGANAVISTRVSKMNSFTGRTGISGVMIRTL